MKKLPLLLLGLALWPASGQAQRIFTSAAWPENSLAYNLLVQQKAKVDLEISYQMQDTDWPRMKRLLFGRDLLKSEMKAMSNVPRPMIGRLTTDYGNLILRSVSLATEIYWISNVGLG